MGRLKGFKVRNRPAPGDRQRVYFLMSSADNPGGLARTVLNLANHLSQSADVEVISIFRRRARPYYEIDEQVKVTHLIDLREPDRPQPLVARFLRPFVARLDAEPSTLAVPAALKDKRMSRLSDWAMWWYLRSLAPGVLVSTHPSLHAAAARWATRRVVKVGQEHMSYDGRKQEVRDLLQEVTPKLDAIAILTEADLKHYQRMAEGSRTVVTAIPNALPWGPIDEGAALDNKIVMAAGALIPRKSFHRLIKAFAPVAEDHPDWQLHIYGSGRSRPHLQNVAERLGLSDQVKLPGRTNRMQDVLLEASAFALTSSFEGFPMVLPEALSKGVPVVSFDCPTGPSDIVQDGRNGFLVPNNDIDGLTQAIRTLVEDEALRKRMGVAALEAGHLYDIKTVGDRWLALFEDLTRSKARR